MSTYTKFTQFNVSQFRSELAAVLTKFGVDANVQVNVGKIKYLPTSLKFEAEVVIEGGQSHSDVCLDNFIARNGLVREKNGKRLIGYKTRNTTYPVIYEDLFDGTRRKCSLQYARFAFSA